MLVCWFGEKLKYSNELILSLPFYYIMAIGFEIDFDAVDNDKR
ncbi:hypothetical protein ES703_93596 [subsurface metagenome]